MDRVLTRTPYISGLTCVPLARSDSQHTTAISSICGHTPANRPRSADIARRHSLGRLLAKRTRRHIARKDLRERQPIESLVLDWATIHEHAVSSSRLRVCGGVSFVSCAGELDVWVLVLATEEIGKLYYTTSCHDVFGGLGRLAFC
jgi:hypothetical protein